MVSIMGVITEPGQTQLTRILSAAWSIASAMVIAKTELGGGVGDGAGRAPDAGNGGDIDNGAATPLPHVRDGTLAAEKCPPKVGLHHLLPGLGRRLFSQARAVNAGVVDEDVQAAMRRHDLVE